MKIILRLLAAALLLSVMLPSRAAKTAPLPQAEAAGCAAFAAPGNPLYIPDAAAFSGRSSLGAETCLIVPQSGWNGGLVVFAHGYVFAYPSDKAVTIPWEQMIFRDANGNRSSIAHLALNERFAFATTSYSKNGLAVVEGVRDVLELANTAKAALSARLPAGASMPVFLIGASEGGLVTTLAVERYPEVFHGGVAACGPIGDFQRQIDYWGNFRVVYDHYFPGHLLGESAMTILPETQAAWGGLSNPGPVLQRNYDRISADLTGNGGRAIQRLLTATGAPVEDLNPASVYITILGILEYNVMATGEAVRELGGVPYSNIDTVFNTYPLDITLNSSVERVSADKAALEAIRADYQTSGLLQRPLVVMHTTADPIVPFWHAELYAQKAARQQAAQRLRFLPVRRYGHCAFTPQEQFSAFQQMLQMAAQQP